jgi:hypothetical protein
MESGIFSFPKTPIIDLNDIVRSGKFFELFSDVNASFSLPYTARVFLYGCGGGGGGGGGHASSAGWGGSGAGAASCIAELLLPAKQVLSWVIGSAGAAGGVGANGTAGGSTIFKINGHTFLVVPGGPGGSYWAIGGAGGIAVEGNYGVTLSGTNGGTTGPDGGYAALMNIRNLIPEFIKNGSPSHVGLVTATQYGAGGRAGNLTVGGAGAGKKGFVLLRHRPVTETSI